MTKYILNSGGLRNNPEGAKKFMAEIVNNLGASPRILFCMFAVPRENWENDFAKYSDWFKTLLPENVQSEFVLAFPDTFEEQIKESDAVYFSGGDDHLLRFWLTQYDIPKVWGGKVVATNSASSSILAQSFWTCDWRKNLNGLNILPIKFISHYRSDFGINDPRGPINWQEAYNELANYGNKKLPIYALEEGEFEVFNGS